MYGAAEESAAPYICLLGGSITVAVLKECDFTSKDELQLGDAVDHGFHRTVGRQDGFWGELFKGEDLLNFLSLGIEDVGQGCLLQGDGGIKICDGLAAAKGASTEP